MIVQIFVIYDEIHMSWLIDGEEMLIEIAGGVR